VCVRVYVCGNTSLVIHMVAPTDVNQYAVQRSVTSPSHSCSSN